MSQVVKEVNFQGDNLLAIQQNDDRVYVSVTYICDGIGLTEGQKKRQVNNVRDDLVLSNGIKKINVNLDETQSRELVCIELDFLPLWLAKISITPKMKKENSIMVEKLVDYQIKAKEVLANAFIHDVTQIIPKNYKEALVELVGKIEEIEILHEENQIMKPKAQYHDDTADSVDLVDMIITAKNVGVGEKKLFEFLRATKVLFKKGSNNYPYQIYQDKGYFKIKQVNKEDNYGRKRIFHPTRVTGEGKIFINKLVNSYGGAEVIDKLKLEEIKEYVENYKLV